MWSSWASEIAADVYAFVFCGWAPLVALANVVDGPTSAVYRFLAGDPHPFPLVRVVFNAALCRSWFGPGPWDTVAEAWLERHPPTAAGSESGALATATLASLGDLVDLCTKRSFTVFHGQPVTALADPRRVSPDALDRFARTAGDSLDTSHYLARHESLRVFTYLATWASTDPTHLAEHRARLRRWLSTLDTDSVATAA